MRIDRVTGSHSVATQINRQGAAEGQIATGTQRGTGQQTSQYNGQRGQTKRSEEELIHSIEEANKKLETYDTRLQFSIHEQTKQIMVRIINTSNDEVIKEFPSEKVLDMVAKMMELAGMLVDEKV